MNILSSEQLQSKGLHTLPGGWLAGNKARGYTEAITTWPFRRFNKKQNTTYNKSSLYQCSTDRGRTWVNIQGAKAVILHLFPPYQWSNNSTPLHWCCDERPHSVTVEDTYLLTDQGLPCHLLDLTYTYLQSPSQKMTNPTCSSLSLPLSDFHLLWPTPLLQNAHVPRLQSVTPEDSAKNLWDMLQDTHHDKKIGK